MESPSDKDNQSNRLQSWNREYFLEWIRPDLEAAISHDPKRSRLDTTDMATVIWTQLNDLAEHLELRPREDFYLRVSLMDGRIAADYNLFEKMVTINQVYLWKIACLFTEGKRYLGKAFLLSLLSHEMYHSYQHKRYPQYMNRVNTQELSRDHGRYLLSNHERAAELFTISYLRSKVEDDPAQAKANAQLAHRLEFQLRKNLIVERSKKVVRRFFGRRDDANG